MQKILKKKNVYTLPIKRMFTKLCLHPFDEVRWVQRDAAVGGSKVFEQKGVEFPDFWSLHAVNITVSKYFRGKLGTPEREKSLKQLLSRVTQTIRRWGEEGAYFAGAAQARGRAVQPDPVAGNSGAGSGEHGGDCRDRHATVTATGLRGPRPGVIIQYDRFHATGPSRSGHSRRTLPTRCWSAFRLSRSPTWGSSS